MIIKSKSYKNIAVYHPVFEYLLRESERESGFVITKFVKGTGQSPEELARQFLKNEEYRKNRRKNNVVLYMDILSFHSEDGEIPNDILKRITKKYISLRAPLSMAIATVHRHEKSHTHIHVCFSGTEYRTGKSNRISRDDFKNKVKLPTEEFQRAHFPELKFSKIDHDKSKQVKKKF